MNPIVHWALAFALTQAIEIPIYLFALRGSAETRSFARRFAIAFGASLLTHPIVWFVIPSAGFESSYMAMTALAEAFAILVEALYFRSLGVRNALRWSFAANAASAIGGLALRYATGWI